MELTTYLNRGKLKHVYNELMRRLDVTQFTSLNLPTNVDDLNVSHFGQLLDGIYLLVTPPDEDVIVVNQDEYEILNIRREQIESALFQRDEFLYEQFVNKIRRYTIRYGSKIGLIKAKHVIKDNLCYLNVKTV
mgnify:CR=1 FL=1